MALEDKVDNLEKKLDMMIKLLQNVGCSFPTKKSVASYFGVTDRTIEYWIKNGKFEEGVEYTKDSNDKIRYITDGILNHQTKVSTKINQQTNTNESKKIEYLNPSTQSLIKSLSCLKN